MFSPNELLLGYQKRWIEDKSPLKIAEKSRRTGLTWAEAADDALIASLRKSDGGSDVFYIGSNKEMAREFIDAVAMWAKAFNYACGQIEEEMVSDESKDILTYVIYFSSGFKVKALSSNPKNLRGMQGVVVIDEAAFHEHLAEVLKAALALTMWGAKVRLISTHNGVDNLFNQLIQDSRAGRKRYRIHTITLDDACKEGLYRRICQVSKKPWSQEAENEWKANLLKDTASEEDALEEYYCVPKASSGAYIPRPLIERATDKDLPVISFNCDARFMSYTEDERIRLTQAWLVSDIDLILSELNKEHRHSVGVDFARNGDLSVFAICEILPDTQRRIVLTLELRNVPYNQQRQVLLHLLKACPRLLGVALDATGNGGYLAESVLIKYGSSTVDSIQLSDKWYREWMPKYKALYESGYIKIPKSEDIITDHAQLQVINGVPKVGSNRSKDGKGKRHGDSAIAYAMAIRASYMMGSTIEYTPLPRHHDLDDQDDAYSDWSGL